LKNVEISNLIIYSLVRTLLKLAQLLELVSLTNLDSNTEPLIEVLKELEAMTTGAWKLPSGDTSERPVGEPSMIRYNSELETFEGYTTEWGPIAGGGGGLAMWMTGEEYIEDESVIWEPLSLKIYVANTTHTAGATFAGDIANWDELSNPFDATNLNITGNSLISTDTNGAVNIAPNGTGDATLTFDGTTVQTLDRQVEVGELIPNNGFERTDLSAVSCTNATITRVADIAGGEFNDHALQITATGTPWSCDIDGAGGQGTGFAQLQSIATVGADAKFCILANGVEQACHQSNILTSKSETFSIPTVLDGTENSIRIKGTSASNVVTADKASMKAGQLATTGYYREQLLSLTGSGNFTGGTLKIVSDGQRATLSIVAQATHSTSVAPNSATGAVPEWARPESTKGAVYSFGSTSAGYWFFVQPDGTFGFRYYASSTAQSRSVSDTTPTITYALPEAQTVQSFNSIVYGSKLLATSSTTQTISTVQTVTFSSATTSNGTFASNQFTVDQSGWYEFKIRSQMNRVAGSSAGTTAIMDFRVNSTVVNAACEQRMRFDSTSDATAADSTRYPPMFCFHEQFLTKGDIVDVRFSSSDGSIELLSRTFSITRTMNPNGEPVSAVIDGYLQAKRADESQPKLCTIRQSTSGTVANLSSPTGCISAGSRTASGVYSGMQLTSGYFKAGTNVDCVASSLRQTADANITICAIQQLAQEGDTFRVKCQNITGTDSDSPFIIQCTGVAP
jgi:hypothetical protein